MTSDETRPIIFVFGGGGARTAAIAGAAAVLHEEGIRADYIVGTSMGFVVGGLLSAGLHPKEICELFSSGRIMNAFLPVHPVVRALSLPWTFLRHLMGRAPYDGFYSSGKFREFLNRNVPYAHDRIEEWKTPVAAVVFNLLSGKSEVLDRGEFGLISTATTAVPGLFRPIEIGDGLYMDGGVLDNLPVAVARNIAENLGGGIVIAINVNEPHKNILPAEHFRRPGNSLFRIISAHYSLTDEPQETLADVVIRVELSINLTSKDNDDARRAIKCGAEAARAALPQIRECLQHDAKLKPGEYFVIAGADAASPLARV